MRRTAASHRQELHTTCHDHIAVDTPTGVEARIIVHDILGTIRLSEMLKLPHASRIKVSASQKLTAISNISVL